MKEIAFELLFIFRHHSGMTSRLARSMWFVYILWCIPRVGHMRRIMRICHFPFCHGRHTKNDNNMEIMLREYNVCLEHGFYSCTYSTYFFYNFYLYRDLSRWSYLRKGDVQFTLPGSEGRYYTCL